MFLFNEILHRFNLPHFKHIKKTVNKTLIFFNNNKFVVLILVVFLRLLGKKLIAMLKKYIIIIIFIISSAKIFSQEFGLPVDITVLLSGTFGELRNNHFHGGIDIKTQSVLNHKILSIEDGYVYKISVSPYSYGKLLIIKHKNGYSSLYCHLNKFADKIEAYTKNIQYKEKSFSIEVLLDSTELKVSKGELIAYSGNTGGSAGPHLHFEIRNQDATISYNPLSFNYVVPDRIAPRIIGLKIYPYGYESKINNGISPVRYSVLGSGKNCYIKTNPIIVSGNAFFGINTYDQLDNSSHINGVYSIELQINGESVFSVLYDKIVFEESRYLNSLIDFYGFKKTSERFAKTYIQPGNNLGNYQNVKGKGVYCFEHDVVYNMKYIVKDIKGNSSELNFTVKGDTSNLNTIKPGLSENYKCTFGYQKANKFSADNLKLTMPAGAIYDSILFEYSTKENFKCRYSKIHQIHYNTTAVHKEYKLYIKPNDYPIKYKDNLLIANVSSNGGMKAKRATWEGDYLVANLKEFGNYTIAIDTIKPRINPSNIYSGKNLRFQKTIDIRISDDFSGIKTFNAYINDEWILMEYEPKEALLRHYIDKIYPQGEYNFRIEVIDEANNTSEYNAKVLF